MKKQSNMMNGGVVLRRWGAGVLAVSMVLLGTACQSGQTEEQGGGASSASLDRFEAQKQHKTPTGPAIDAGSLALLDDVQRVEDPASDREVARGWQLSLTAPKAQFLLGEPVTVQVSLQNIAADAQDASALLLPEFHMVRYSVIAPDGSEHAFQPIAQYCTLPALAKKTFQPGEKVSEEVRVFAARGGWVFDEPGVWQIRASFEGEGPNAPHMLSNSVKLVVAPGTAAEQAAARQLMEGEAALLLQWERGDHLKDGLRTLEQVAAQVPGSVHALYAHYVLGNNLSQSFFDGKSERAARPQEAIPHLEAARALMVGGLDSGLPASVRGGVYRQLVASYEAVGQKAQAQLVREEARSRYGAALILK